MRFSWDENKNRLNQKKHGVRFQEAQTIFDDPLAVSVVDHEHSILEERWFTIGMSRRGRLLFVAHTYWAPNGDELIRIINARKPTIYEQRLYEEERHQ
jgi:uncharacterized DUF497 family protein